MTTDVLVRKSGDLNRYIWLGIGLTARDSGGAIFDPRSNNIATFFINWTEFDSRNHMHTNADGLPFLPRFS